MGFHLLMMITLFDAAKAPQELMRKPFSLSSSEKPKQCMQSLSLSYYSMGRRRWVVIIGKSTMQHILNRVSTILYSYY